MTTGTINSDNRTNVEQVYNGLGTGTYLLVGDWLRKTWAGSDSNGTDKRPLPEHPYSMTSTDISDNIVLWEYFDTSGTKLFDITKTSGVMGVPLGSPSSLWTSNDDLKLINKAANKIRGSDLNVGNIIAECGQTTALFAQTATRIAKMLHYIHQGNLYEAARSVTAKGKVVSVTRKVLKPLKLSDASDAILELQYGWRPLLRDVDSAVQGLANRAHLGIQQKTKVTRRLKDNVIYTLGAPKYLLQREVVVQYRIVHSIPNWRTVYNLNNPLAALHEVTPFSFVGDWFIPVNDYLQAINFKRDFGLTSVWKSTFLIASATFLGSNDPHIQITGGSSRIKKVSLLRESVSFDTLADVPVPRLKDISKALSPEHLLNAGALLTSSAGRFQRMVKF